MNTNLRYLADNGLLSLNGRPAYLQELIGPADFERSVTNPCLRLEDVGLTAEETLGPATYKNLAIGLGPPPPLLRPPLCPGPSMLPSPPPRNPYCC